jgi:aspartyl-tRNA(Asn)/glutamyl-tRNA(Gln) amidotransferase subunit A
MLQNEFRALLKQVDCLLTPTTPTAAPRQGEAYMDIQGQREDVRLASTRLVRGVNPLGLPALSLPAGLDRQGLPVSMQLIGRPFEEALVVRVAAALEAAVPAVRPPEL